MAEDFGEVLGVVVDGYNAVGIQNSVFAFGGQTVHLQPGQLAELKVSCTDAAAGADDDGCLASLDFLPSGAWSGRQPDN